MLNEDQAGKEAGRRRTVLDVVYGYGWRCLPKRAVRGRAQEAFPDSRVEPARARPIPIRIDRNGMVSNVRWAGGRSRQKPNRSRQYDTVLLGSQKGEVWMQLFGIGNKGIHVFECLAQLLTIRLDHGLFQFGRVSSGMILQQTFCQPRP